MSVWSSSRAGLALAQAADEGVYTSVCPILTGQTDQALMLDQLERPLPASWDEQLLAFRCAG
jgi:hypothetical protein